MILRFRSAAKTTGETYNVPHDNKCIKKANNV